MLRQGSLSNLVYPTAVSLGAFVLRLLFLDRKGLWLDEVASLWLAQGDIAQILSNRFEPHPPLYYLMLHWVSSWGTSEFLLRLPSAMAGALSVPVLYLLAKQWLGQRGALLASLLLAISPLHIAYSQEARMYSLVTFWGLLSTLFFTRAIAGRNRLAWAGYWVATLGGLYTHYAMVALVAMQYVFVALLALREGRYRTPLMEGVVALVLVFVGYWPWLPTLWLQGAGFTQQHVVLRTKYLLESLGLGFLAGVEIPMALGALAIALGVVWWLGMTAERLYRSRLFYLAAHWAPYGLVTVAVVLPWGASIKRQALILVPYFLAMVVLGTERQGLRRTATAGLVGLALVVLPWGYLFGQREDWPAVASLVQSAGQPGDVILLHAGYVQTPFEHYYRGAIPRMGAAPQDLDRQLADIQAKYQRVWVLLSHDTYVDPEGRLRRWLAERWDLQQEWAFAGIEVRLYRTAGSPTSMKKALVRWVAQATAYLTPRPPLRSGEGVQGVRSGHPS